MARSPFTVDWANFEAVCKYCDELNAEAKPGFESVVVRHKGKTTYNITHASRSAEAGAVILYPEGRD